MYVIITFLSWLLHTLPCPCMQPLCSCRWPFHTSALHAVHPQLMIQVRLQQPGSPYSSSSVVIAAVLRCDGVRGLWKGATPGVVRQRVSCTFSLWLQVTVMLNRSSKCVVCGVIVGRCAWS
jgi:hypothetical protein